MTKKDKREKKYKINMSFNDSIRCTLVDADTKIILENKTSITVKKDNKNIKLNKKLFGTI